MVEKRYAMEANLRVEHGVRDERGTRTIAAVGCSSRWSLAV